MRGQGGRLPARAKRLFAMRGQGGRLPARAKRLFAMRGQGGLFALRRAGRPLSNEGMAGMRSGAWPADRSSRQGKPLLPAMDE